MKNKKKLKVSSKHFSRRDFLSTGLKAGAAAFTTGLIPKLPADAEENYNVLFIVVDDLRPLLGCYGHSEIHTPNIDQLAQRGTLFNKAYCQLPLCNPSRASILTGLRPETTGIFTNSGDYREILPNVVDLQPYFNNFGYNTYSVGKIAHAWARFVPGPSWQALDVDDDELSDGITAKHTEEILMDIKEEQFFLAVGFDKPHLPFYAPKKYYEIYDTNTFNLPTTSSYPLNSPSIARNSINLLRLYSDIPNGDVPLSDEKILELIHAYAASTSYMDAQVGRVLRQLDTFGLTEKTIIVFLGDHGFHLGEHGTWRKNTLFEVSVRSPLIISVPGQTHTGTQTDALVELVDIFPTLCDACKVPIPSQLEGLSLLPVIETPTRQWKTAAFSQLDRGGARGNTMRTAQFRYTEWGNDGQRGQELYDYYADPNETINLAHLPEYSELLAHLKERLHAGWQGALPDNKHIPPIPIISPWDINNDGIVDIQDLIVIAKSFGTDSPENPKVDVNRDGKINIIDLLIVAAHLGETTQTAAPSTHTKILQKHLNLLDKWLTEARLADDGTEVFKQGIATLETLLEIAIPEKTVLLPNYPNPFNPETWIPYDLAQDTDVHIHIFNLKGELIRKLSLGFQTAGTYRTQSRSAHWDGHNSAGEPVASGVYFYTLRAGQTKATRKMVIAK